jgi:hypothetical protein
MLNPIKNPKNETFLQCYFIFKDKYKDVRFFIQFMFCFLISVHARPKQILHLLTPLATLLFPPWNLQQTVCLVPLLYMIEMKLVGKQIAMRVPDFLFLKGAPVYIIQTDKTVPGLKAQRP